MHCEGRIVFTNPAGARLVGATSPQEVVGQHVREIVHPASRIAVTDRIRRLLAGEQGLYPVEEVYVRRDGSSVPVEVVAVPLTFNGKPAVQAIVTDLTERKRAEEDQRTLELQFRTAQKMEAVGRLAGGVAHDFNNLLAVILAYGGFARDALSEGNPTRGDVEQILGAGRRAASLTRQLLAFSRKQVLEPMVLDLNRVAADLQKMLNRLIGEDIRLVQLLAPDIGRVRADPGQLEQVIMNLVVNARDAMPDGGRLTIETANVEIEEAYAGRHEAVPPGSYVQLAISDTGCGMDERTMEKLFEPFFTTKEKGKGTGLGLSTVYGIVKQSGGKIAVHSEPGKGTTFNVYLPRVHDEPSPMEAHRDREVPPVGNETILVVEDETAVRELAARMLRAAGFAVLTAENGDEALLASGHHQGEIHLLLTDVVMPGMSGRLLAERLAELRPGVRVLYMSGYTDDAIIHHGVLKPGTRFIGKPFSAAELARRVRDSLDEHV